MTSSDPSAEGGSASTVGALRALLTTTTQQLLGDTISISDDLWRGESRLAGWSRGHVATHLARQADAFGRLIRGVRSGEPEPMYGDAEQRDREIEAGAGRSGLELQIDLDTSAGALSDAFDAVDHDGLWDSVVELRGGDHAELRLLPLGRVAEVVLHHIDLDIGLDVSDLPVDTADRLLEWLAFRLAARAGYPRVRVVTESGLTVDVGHEGEPVRVAGPSAALVGWLTGRSVGDDLEGAAALTLPAF